jgi:hypothetical protein
VASHPTTYGATAPTERTLLHATVPLRITFLATAPTITMADEAAAAPVTLCVSLKVMTGGILLDLACSRNGCLLACGKSDCASTIMTKLMKTMKATGEMNTDY